MRILFATVVSLALLSPPASAQALQCNVSGFTPAPGIAASLTTDTLTVTWDGDQGQEVRMRLGIVSGTPTIRDLAVRAKGGAWKIAGANMTEWGGIACSHSASKRGSLCGSGLEAA